MEQKKVLIIEDEQFFRDLLSKKLVSENILVLEAIDGEEGLAKALANHPDLIILDIALPKLNGIEVLDKLRNDEWGKGAQIIMLTNSSLPSDISDSLNNRIMKYIVKVDWSFEDIIKQIKSLLY